MTRKKCSPGTVRICSLFAIALTLAVPASAEWKEKVLYSFQGVPDGATPTGAMVFDKAGNLYGATLYGGASTYDNGPGQCGTVYKLAPPATKGGAWTETVLYIFKGHAQNDGATPEGGLVIDEAGNLYGTTGYGGSGPCLLLGGAVGCGTVYELSPPAKQGNPWMETVLYSFQGARTGTWRQAIWYSTSRATCMERRCLAAARERPAIPSTEANVRNSFQAESAEGQAGSGRRRCYTLSPTARTEPIPTAAPVSG